MEGSATGRQRLVAKSLEFDPGGNRRGMVCGRAGPKRSKGGIQLSARVRRLRVASRARAYDELSWCYIYEAGTAS
jgi:hypothetical protein